MLQAFIKLVAITLGAIILTFFALFLIRQMGQGAVFHAPPHPWFAQKEWKFLAPTGETLCATEDVDKLVPSPDWIMTLPIVWKKDHWIIRCGDGEPKDAAAFLQAQKHKNWLIEVRAEDTWGMDELTAMLSEGDKAGKHFAIWAEAQKVSVYLRRKGPEWLFAADTSSLLRFRMYESMWIETAMEFWPDFVITDFTGTGAIDERGARELIRREKRIIWKKPEGAATAPQIPIQGTMTTRPE